MKTLVLGGVRSGKSKLAESLALKSNQQIVYIATATIGDAEMQARIDLHKKNRPASWILVEEPLKLASVVKQYSGHNYCIIIDCLTLWVTNLLLNKNSEYLPNERQAFASVLENSDENIIIVSNETSLGIMPMGALSRQFGDEAGIINQTVAALCDRVVLTVAGLPLLLKGEPL
jgi:adenosylcobinamide kinase/adenosylcobinamide-phosphate guanylyltransferase